MPFSDSLIGSTLANYHIERLLGRGGMASVYYGVDTQLQRPAAIKVIDERHSGETSYSARFVREARAMASWRHPNIPQIYQAGVENGIYFYAMEYIHGMDLEDLLLHSVQKGELLPFDQVLRYGKSIAEALDYAHRNGAIHRDVKPSNVLISEDGRIMLTDFGLVLEIDKGTQGEVFGSPLYIAPEQARSSADAVPQSDLYSLGVILYEMLVGRLPFEDQSSASLAMKHMFLAPPAPRQLNPDLNPEVEAVLLKALLKLPQERYQTGKDLLSALEEAIGGHFTGIRVLHTVVQPPVTQAFLPIDPADHLQQANINPGASGNQTTDASTQMPWPAAHNLEISIPGEVIKRSMPRPRKKYILAAIITISVLAIFCGFLIGTVWLFGRLTGSAGLPEPTSLAGQSPLTTTSKPLNTGTLQSPTSNANEIHISLSLQKTDTFMVTNLGKIGVPLAQLRFGSAKDKFTGNEWGIDQLQPGQCVIIMKQEGHPAPPTGAQCKIVGKFLTMGGPKKFWEKKFDVYFQNILVDSCSLENTACDLLFSNSQP